MKEKHLPDNGMSREEILSFLENTRKEDLRWKSGRTFSLIYNPGEEIMKVGMDAYRMYMVENGLSPFAFPSLKILETEVAAICSSIFHGSPKAVGSMTCGGTESIFMAVKTARDRAFDRNKNIANPRIVIPVTAHPAFDKASHYLGLQVDHIPVGDDFRAVPEAMAAAADENTVMMVGSAMTYPHGVVDPIPELAAIAADKKIWFHTDSCLGGFILPFVKKLGYDVPDFDFSVPGVTSMSADLHKYGFAPKGASIVMYRDSDYRQYQYFAYADWPGGVYGTSTLAGARTGGAIAGAWAVLHHLGEEGYLRLAKQAMDTVKKLINGINAIPALKVQGAPHATVFSIGSDEINVYALSDELAERGWLLEKQHLPPCLHVTVSPNHANVADEFLEVLADAVEKIKDVDLSNLSQEAAMYGMMATMPDRSLARQLAVEYMNDLYKLS